MPCRVAVRSGSCLPRGPQAAVTSASISCCITCRPAPTARASSPSRISAAISLHRHAHLVRHGQRARVERSSLVLLGHSGPLSWVVLADAQHLPHGRSRAGDRHLKFHESRDNLPLQTRGTYVGLASPPLLPRCVVSGNPLILRIDVLERREWVGS